MLFESTHDMHSELDTVLSVLEDVLIKMQNVGEGQEEGEIRAIDEKSDFLVKQLAEVMRSAEEAQSIIEEYEYQVPEVIRVLADMNV